MGTSLGRFRAKIIALETKIADLRIAEREIQALDKLPARKTRPAPGPKPKPKPKRKPEASNQAEARRPSARRSLTFSAGGAPFRPPRSPSISGRKAETSAIEPYPFRCNRSKSAASQRARTASGRSRRGLPANSLVMEILERDHFRMKRSLH